MYKVFQILGLACFGLLILSAFYAYGGIIIVLVFMALCKIGAARFMFKSVFNGQTRKSRRS
jgi:hypothetical protein